MTVTPLVYLMTMPSNGYGTSPLRNNRPQPGSVCICALPGKVEGNVEDGDALKLAQHAPSDDEGDVVEA
jgi:hypothetical protein